MKRSVKFATALPIVVFAAAIVNAQGPPPPGGPLVGLTTAELQLFNAGRDEFLQNETPQSGLGPVFNGVSCVQCHGAGAPGGASPDLGVSVVTRIGAVVNNNYTDLDNLGGALIQARSLREIIQNYRFPVKSSRPRLRSSVVESPRPYSVSG
ncbi:MAG: hypothetical protein ABL949_08605 [Fimbriimonadaceae bacterium]